jgi:hypothetical protein
VPIHRVSGLMPLRGIGADDVKMTPLVAPSPDKVQRSASPGKVFFRGKGDATAAAFRLLRPAIVDGEQVQTPVAAPMGGALLHLHYRLNFDRCITRKRLHPDCAAGVYPGLPKNFNHEI